ncbi:TPA_asm: hypothetical protein vir520_00049 [Caudoviricetes sp. vir520]|nr:TPA_asm: hypothetical protein vir520_00049 [Caudoviricetes sp. vir520]
MTTDLDIGKRRFLVDEEIQEYVEKLEEKISEIELKKIVKELEKEWKKYEM